MIDYSFESQFPIWYKKLLQEDPNLENIKKIYGPRGNKLDVIRTLKEKEYISGLLEAKNFFDKFLEEKLKTISDDGNS